jgi:hypothetical protein
VAARDECADTGKTTRPYEREHFLEAAPDHLVHAQQVVNGNMETEKKDRPAG